FVLGRQLGRDRHAFLAAGEEDARIGASTEDFLDGVAGRIGGGERGFDRLQELLQERVDLPVSGHRVLRYHRAVQAAWTRLSSAALYTRGKLTLREDAWRLPDGQQVVYPVVAVGVTVGVLPFVEPARVLLVGQYRHLVGKVSWELPGGGAQPGEDPMAAAQ